MIVFALMKNKKNPLLLFPSITTGWYLTVGWGTGLGLIWPGATNSIWPSNYIWWPIGSNAPTRVSLSASFCSVYEKISRKFSWTIYGAEFMDVSTRADVPGVDRPRSHLKFIKPWVLTIKAKWDLSRICIGRIMSSPEKQIVAAFCGEKTPLFEEKTGELIFCFSSSSEQKQWQRRLKPNLDLKAWNRTRDRLT